MRKILSKVIHGIKFLFVMVMLIISLARKDKQKGA